ncbi:MAG: metallophosphoesterase [Bacteroidaceae bacterium]|nr:metallophosphoesterase [Bacteroidaceae bacterium]
MLQYLFLKQNRANSFSLFLRHVRKNILLVSLLLLTSCSSSIYPHFSGIGRVKEYAIYSADLPASFDSFRVAFIADLHYKSKFKKKQLISCVSALKLIRPDALLLGGDYQEGCAYVEELFRYLSQVNPTYGVYGVLGNNDYERCTDSIRRVMKRYNMQLLEHKVATIVKGRDSIFVCGIRDPFNLKKNGISPTLSLSPQDFVILLTHTPDYAEQVDISNSDLVLAGHTHGGQIRFLKWIVPHTGSVYKKRFLTGKAMTDQGIPVITTNGLGTSRIKFRFGSPSEIVVVTLHKKDN